MKAERPEARPIAGGTDLLVELNFDRARPETILNLNEVEELRGWSRENGELRLGSGLTYAEAMRAAARRAPARARRGVPHGRLAADPEPRHDRRQSRHGVSRRRRAAAAARRGRAGRARQRPRGARACRSRTSSSGRSGTRSSRTSSCSRCGCTPSGQPQTFMKVGPRNAMVIAVCSLALVADRERGELRAAYGSSGPVVGLVTAPLDERDAFADAVAAACVADRRRPRHGGLPPARAPRPDGPGARPVPAREDRAHGQRRAARGGRLGRREPADDAPRHARAARLEERLRAGRVRLVLGAARRRARLRLPRARRAGRRARGDDGRGPRRRRRAPPRPARVRRGRAPSSAASARPGSSSRRRRCSRRIPIPRTTSSARRSPAISAAARATRRSSTRSGWRPAHEQGHGRKRHGLRRRAAASSGGHRSSSPLRAYRSRHPSFATRECRKRADSHELDPHPQADPRPEQNLHASSSSAASATPSRATTASRR